MVSKENDNKFELKKLYEISSITMGQSPESKFYNYNGKGMPLIQGNADIKDRRSIIRTYTSHITKTCERGEIIMSVRAPVGKVAIATADSCIGRGVCSIKYNNMYLYHYLVFKEESWNNISKGSTFDSISSKDILEFNIYLPKEISEQKSIATALSDMDDLILSLEKLIDKKKMIKEGAMEELLTGKKRLKGFNNKWNEIVIDKIGKSYGGLTGKSKEHFGNGNALYIPFMNVMNNPIIDESYLEAVVIKDNEMQNRVRKDDLLFNTSSETPEEVGMCSVLKNDINNLYLNSFCFGFRLNNPKEISSLFISYLFRSKIGRKMMESLAQGSTRYNLSKSNFNKLTIQLPNFDEQEAIATILSDMDEEIKNLDKKLDKYKNIKVGMMEELLTGKRRLV